MLATTTVVRTRSRKIYVDARLIALILIRPFRILSPLLAHGFSFRQERRVTAFEIITHNRRPTHPTSFPDTSAGATSTFYLKRSCYALTEFSCRPASCLFVPWLIRDVRSYSIARISVGSRKRIPSHLPRWSSTTTFRMLGWSI